MISLLVLTGFLVFSYLLGHKLLPRLYGVVLRAFGLDPTPTPMMQRRIERFCTIRRGYWSYVIITTLFIASLFLELMVNKRALLIVYEDRWATPAISNWLGQPSYQKASDFGLDGEGDVKYRTFQRYCQDPTSALADLPKMEKQLAKMQASLPKKPVAPAPPAKPKDPGPDAKPEETEAYELAQMQYEMDLDDYKLSKPELEKKYASALAEYELREKALLQQRDSIERLKTGMQAFEQGRAWIIMPLHPYSPEERLLAEFPDLSPPIAPGWAVSINKALGIHHQKTTSTIDNPDEMTKVSDKSANAPRPLLGLTDNGADVLCQIVYGFRISIIFALIVASIGFTIGTIVGGAMGYYGGWFDILVQRFIEIWGGIPFLYTIMIIASVMQPGVILLAVLMIILRSWMGITYTIRGEFYREKAKDYVQAAISIGVSDWKIITKHILPNSLVPVVTFAPFAIVGYIGSLVSLDYLGFGLKPGTPSWGYLLQQGKEYLSHPPYWYLIAIPSTAFAGTLFLVVMIGEAVREGFDPKVFARLR